MDYASLKSDILSILHSSDYDFELKLYDSEGNTTLSSEDINWIYIKNENIMVEMPTTENPSLYFWKEKRTENDNVKDLIKRVRELCVLNGVEVEVETYNNLDRRKIYNIIMTSLENSKDRKMSESKNVDLSKALYELTSLVNGVKRPSDTYISESLCANNKKELIETTINTISNINSLSSKSISKLLKLSLLENSFNRIKALVKSFEKQKPEEYSKLCENTDNIINAGKFLKNRYLNNIPTNNKNIIKVLENVIVYKSKSKLDKENLVKAYNHLISVCEGAKTGIDMLRIIKNNKLCETYKVSKNDLLDMWLSKSSDALIKPKTLIIFETSNGNKYTFDSDIAPSINLLAEHFNNNGSSDDKITQEIVNETIKLNNLTDLIENYSDNFGIRKYASQIKRMYRECLENLKSIDSINNKLLQESRKPYDYSKELAVLEEKLGFKHSSLKYIAMEEALENDNKSLNMTLEAIKDEKILREGLSLVLPYNKTKEIAYSILKSKLCKVKPIKENKEDKLSTVKCLFDNIYSSNAEVKNAVDDCLFLIGSNPKGYNKQKQKFVETLNKYII